MCTTSNRHRASVCISQHTKVRGSSQRRTRGDGGVAVREWISMLAVTWADEEEGVWISNSVCPSGVQCHLRFRYAGEMRSG